MVIFLKMVIFIFFFILVFNNFWNFLEFYHKTSGGVRGIFRVDNASVNQTKRFRPVCPSTTRVRWLVALLSLLCCKFLLTFTFSSTFLLFFHSWQSPIIRLLVCAKYILSFMYSYYRKSYMNLFFASPRMGLREELYSDKIAIGEKKVCPLFAPKPQAQYWHVFD